MHPKWREFFLEWSKTAEFKEKLKDAEKLIDWALSTFRKPYVAFSGGKDSTVVLHMVLSKKEDVTVVHWDYERYFIPKSIHKEIIEIAKKCGVKDFRIYTSRLYGILKENATNVLGRKFLGKIIPKLKEEGYDCCFLGLRGEEAVKRKIKVKDGWFKEKGIVNVCPLRLWSWKDVWSYIVSKDVPYLRSYYDKYAEFLGYDKTRFVTIFDKEFEKFGNINVDKFLMWKHKKF